MRSIGVLAKERRPEAAYGHLLPQGEKEEGLCRRRRFSQKRRCHFQIKCAYFRASSWAFSLHVGISLPRARTQCVESSFDPIGIAHKKDNHRSRLTLSAILA